MSLVVVLEEARGADSGGAAADNCRAEEAGGGRGALAAGEHLEEAGGHLVVGEPLLGTCVQGG
jgi:hypothetical protein